jgi:hypothetical protein
MGRQFWITISGGQDAPSERNQTRAIQTQNSLWNCNGILFRDSDSALDPLCHPIAVSKPGNSSRLSKTAQVETNATSHHKMYCSRVQLANFRRTVSGPHVRIPWAERIRCALFFVKQHPTTARDIGLIPTEDGFLINSAACAAFFGVKQNSCNRNCQQHGLLLDARCDVLAEIRQNDPTLEIEKSVSHKRRFVGGRFTGQSSPTEVNAVIAYGRLSRSGLLSECALAQENRNENPMSGSGVVDDSGPTIVEDGSNEREIGTQQAGDGDDSGPALDLDLCTDESGIPITFDALHLWRDDF